MQLDYHASPLVRFRLDPLRPWISPSLQIQNLKIGILSQTIAHYHQKASRPLVNKDKK